MSLNYCKPLHKIASFLTKLSIVGSIAGLILGLTGYGWIILIVFGCLLFVSFILARIPENIIAGELKKIDYSLTSKEAFDATIKHLTKDKSSTDMFIATYDMNYEVSKIKKS